MYIGRSYSLTVIFCVVCSWSSGLLAQSPSDKADADVLFTAARELVQSGEYEAACPKFKESHQLDPGVGTLLNLGLCYEKLGKTTSAWSSYREAAALARKQGDEAREKFARDEVSRLDAQLVKVLIEVSAESQAIEALEILRDGVLVRSSMWGVPVPVDPGEVKVEARAPGYKPEKATLKATKAGNTVTYRVPVLKRESEAAPPAASTEEARPEETGAKEPPPAEAAPPADTSDATNKRKSTNLGPWILGGAGVAALGAGGVFGILMLDANKKAQDVCPDQSGDGTATGRCTQNQIAGHERLTNQANLFRTASYIGYGVGGAAVAGAAVWMILAPTKKESALQVEPQMGATWGLQARGEF